MKRIIAGLLVTLLLLTGCSEKDTRSDDIVILFTNDIHCGIDENVTLAGVAGYKEYMKTKSKYVTLVDCGDAIQGSSIGLASQGEVVVDAMNAVGYDFAIFGNHEFDFGIDQLQFLMDKANAQYLNANIKYIGNKENKLEKSKPYEIVTYGKTKVAFIGVTTPVTIRSSKAKSFIEDDKMAYDFSGENNGQDLFDTVQGYVDEVRGKGADYVVVLAHLGIGEEGEDALYTATGLINNTNGIDVLLDGHSHSIYLRYCTENKDTDYVVSAQTGTKLQSLGQLVIDEKGVISVSLVSDITRVDDEAKNKIDGYIDSYSELLGEVLFTNSIDLKTTDTNGTRMVRNRETNIGDFVSDAYRYVTGADISYVNGGGIRNDIKAGEVAISDVVSVSPFGNTVCVVEVTGQEILDLLEYYVKDVKADYHDEYGVPIGENGSFPCMSGIRFTVDTSIPTSIIVDENDALTGIGETRRVSDVEVEMNGKYIPIDPNRTYTLASHNYMIKEGGSGGAVYMKDHNIVMDDVALDYEVLIYYLKDILKYDLSRYEKVDNRITIK